MTEQERIEVREELNRLKTEGKYTTIGSLQQDMLDEYGWCFKKDNDGSFGDMVIDLAQTEYENELDFIDRKCDAWVKEKLEKKTMTSKEELYRRLVEEPESFKNGEEFFRDVTDNPEKFPNLVIKGNQVWNKETDSLVYVNIPIEELETDVD